MDATGLLVLPGCVDVHTHPTPDKPSRIASSPIRSPPPSVGTTTFLAFNNPGTGISDEGPGPS